MASQLLRVGPCALPFVLFGLIHAVNSSEAGARAPSPRAALPPAPNSSLGLPNTSSVNKTEAQFFVQHLANLSREGHVKSDPGLLCNATEDAEMREFFKDVVLIIHVNFAWVAHRTVLFWRHVYGRLFQDIVFLSDKGIPGLKVEARSIERYAKDWRMCYANLPKIMARYPHAQGFLWTNDDVVINYWNLVRADKTKLWMPNNETKSSDIRWFHFDMRASEKWSKDWPAFGRWKKVMNGAFKQLDKEYLQRYNQNILPHKDEYPKRITDLFYIPKRFAEELSFSLLPQFQFAGAPSELAIPAMFYILDNPKNWDPVLDAMVYRWDQWEARVQHKRCNFRPEEAWNASIPAFHPWKVSKDGEKSKLIRALMSADPCIFSLKKNDTSI